MNDQNSEVQPIDAPAVDEVASSTPSTAATPVARVQANFDNKVDVQEVNFSFRKVVDEKTGTEDKRPTITLPILKPSVEGLVAILEAGGKGLELLLEAAADVVVARARDIINENSDITADNFPYDKLTWEAIALLPKAERRGGGIPKETWEEFNKDYIAIMPSLTGKAVDKVENAARNFANKFAAVKTNKKVLGLLVDQLGIYLEGAPKAEEFLECITFLTDKANKLMNMSEEDLLANL